MNGIKCPECGLVNFSAAGECKRCHVKFHQPESIPDASSSVTEDLPQAVEPEDENLEKAPPPPLDDYFHGEASYSVPVILFAVWLAINWLAVAVELKFYFSFFNSGTWSVMTDPGMMAWLYNPILEPLFYMELIAHIAVFIAVPVLLILLSQKSWSFVRWIRIYLLGGLIFQAVEIVALLGLRAYLPGKETLQPFDLLLRAEFWVAYALLTIVSASLTLICFAYFSRSERVKRIFIN